MFENIIGNETVKNTLKKSIETNQITHSYLMIGIPGIGKKLIAKEYSKEILGRDILNNPDFLCIQPDGNSIKIEQIRQLQKEIQEKPIISNKKVYIIDDADFMTKEAQNCLLKTLEEPPEFAVIILIGSNENSFLPTIKSRCMILHFRELYDSEIIEYLQKEYNEQNVTQSMLDIAGGSIGRAISLKDKQEQYQKVEAIIKDLEKKDLIDIIQESEVLYKSKDDINDMLEYINIILLKMAKDNYLYTDCIKIVENTKKRLAQNANYDMCIDYMLFKMWEEVWKIITILAVSNFIKNAVTYTTYAPLPF